MVWQSKKGIVRRQRRRQHAGRSNWELGEVRSILMKHSESQTKLKGAFKKEGYHQNRGTTDSGFNQSH